LSSKKSEFYEKLLKFINRIMANAGKDSDLVTSFRLCRYQHNLFFSTLYLLFFAFSFYLRFVLLDLTSLIRTARILVRKRPGCPVAVSKAPDG